ncbi:unnamed protein product [Arabis nemorensis]|uniref:Pentacotripeptide-repeat region of PRORP domain-containing protein n=1 Tax=Arabis nemorensis TaxID=586526 RepID=A0A565AN23_9BRAS|nr:unnamed protein product [Arabis nemorensis]
MRLPILQPCARAFRRYFFRSAGTLSSPELNDSLPVLEQWKRQGNQLNPSDIRNIIKTLGDSQRFTQALKVSEWMSERQLCNLIPEDFAARLYLIDNVLGLEEATKFFLSIPECKRDHSVGKRQMEMNNVEPDNLTLNIKLRLYAAEFDIEKLTKAIKDKESDDWKNKDSKGYRLVISSLLKSGDIDMATEITEEWYDGFYKFDVRIVAMMASAYCESGLIWEAERWLSMQLQQQRIEAKKKTVKN